MDILMADFISKTLQKKWATQILRTLSVVIGILGIFYFFWKNLFIRWEDVDFKVIWLSGHLWLDGISPYSNQFAEAGYQLFDKFNGQPFYYPPHFLFLSSFYALFEFETGKELWRWTNIILFFASSMLLKSVMSAVGTEISWRHILFYTGLIGFMQSVVLIFHLGQTSVLIYFSICLIIFGVFKKNSPALIIGLCIVLLKPQIGVALLAAFLVLNAYHKPVLITSLLMIFLSLPGMMTLGLTETMGAYLNNVSGHGDFYPNMPKMTTGFRNIIYLVSGYELSSAIAALTPVILVFGSVYYLKLKILNNTAEGGNDLMVIVLMLAISYISVFSPLHAYDFIFLAPVLILSWRFGYPFQAYILMLFFIITRYDNITRVTGILKTEGEVLIGNELLSLTAIVMLAIIILNIRKIIDVQKQAGR